MNLICDQEPLQFYLGTHRPRWLLDAPPHVGLFLSHNVLRHRKTLPDTRQLPFYRHVAIDSGAFSEIAEHGEFTTSPREYIQEVARYDNEIGDIDWAAPQDHMCEPPMLAKTGLKVRDHLKLTVENFCVLEELWPQYGHGDCPIMPVLQGWHIDDYLLCYELYEAAGVRLTTDYPVVGVGSVCRREATDEIGRIFATLARLDLPLHGFGVKTAGIRKYGRYLTTADSMAWSYRGRREPTKCGSTTHKNEANCMTFALEWLDRVLAIIPDKGGPEAWQDILF